MAYNPVKNHWRLLPAMPLPRHWFAAVWTGHRVLVWGGLNSHRVPPAHGEAYNPATNRWSALPPAPLRGRAWPLAAWGGHQMIIWGGFLPGTKTTRYFTDGAAYRP